MPEESLFAEELPVVGRDNDGRSRAIETVKQRADLRFAGRVLRKSPVFTLVMIFVKTFENGISEPLDSTPIGIDARPVV